MYSCEGQSEDWGFPIRKSPDQSLFAAPRRLSQRITSFIASQCQGIHQMPLSRLIILIIDAHPGLSALGKEHGRDGHQRKDFINCASFCLPWGGQAPLPAARGPMSGKILHSRCQKAFSAGNNPGTETVCWPAGQIPACHNGVMAEEDGGDRRDRTDDLKLAKLPLSQLSYVPS
jgi:hypothetical protein